MEAGRGAYCNPIQARAHGVRAHTEAGDRGSSPVRCTQTRWISVGAHCRSRRASESERGREGRGERERPLLEREGERERERGEPA